jgi:hypothetical protein
LEEGREKLEVGRRKREARSWKKENFNLVR